MFVWSDEERERIKEWLKEEVPGLVKKESGALLYNLYRQMGLGSLASSSDVDEHIPSYVQVGPGRCECRVLST